MSEHAPPGAHFADDVAPATLVRNLAAGSRLIASAASFFFLSFLFAYFYLRSLNTAGQWRPKGVDTSIGLGIAVLVGSVACAVLVRLAFADHSAGKAAASRLKLAGALALGVAALVLQIVEWFVEGFGPTEGGFASVFIGWTGVYALFLLVALIWLEMATAGAFRYREEQAPSAGPDQAALVGAQLDGISFFWTFLAGVGVLTFIVLYLV